MQPHTHSNLDPNPTVIQCSSRHEKEAEYYLKKNAKFTVEWAIRCASLEFYLFLLDSEDQEVLTSASIPSLNFLSSLSRICLYLFNSSAMLFIFFSAQNMKMAELSKKWCHAN